MSFSDSLEDYLSNHGSNDSTSPIDEEDAISDAPPSLVPSNGGYSINDLYGSTSVAIESTAASSLLPTQVVSESSMETTLLMVDEEQGYQPKTLLHHNYEENKRWSILPKFPCILGSTADIFNCLLLSNVPCEC
jgi:hypothetical protein